MNVVEAVGFGLVIAFLYCMWPPLALLGGGLLLVAWANTRTASGRLAVALRAARDAYRRAGPSELTGRRAA